MNNMVISAAASFLLGAFFYILYRFWVRPIFQYRSIKKKVIQGLTSYLNSISPDEDNTPPPDTQNGKIEVMRKHAVELTDCYQMALPDWYRLLLQSRGESPENAAKHLLVLSNTRNYDHAQNRMEKIKDSLKI